MSRVFAITTDRETVQLDLEGKGEIAFTVTNSTERPLRGAAKISPQDSTKAEWLSIAGELERDYPATATQQVAVKIAVPPGTPAAKYPFRLNVSSTANPDDDYGEGPLVIFESVEVKKPFPWWIIAVIVAVALVGGAVAIFLLIPKKVDVPNVITLPLKEAEKKISERGLVYKKEVNENPNAKVEIVLDQDPKEGRIQKGGELTLTVEAPVPPFPMPDFAGTGKNIKEAQDFFSDKYVNLVLNQTIPTISEPEGKILAQAPAKDKPVSPGDTVTLTFVPHLTPFPMPGVVGKGKQLVDAKRELENLGLKVTSNDRLDPSVNPGIVVDQQPLEGAQVKSGDPVQLTEAYTLVNVPTINPGTTWQQARDALNKAGLYVSQVHGDCKSAVIRSEPAFNTPVKKNSRVVLITGGDPNNVCYRGIFMGRVILFQKDQIKLPERKP